MGLRLSVDLNTIFKVIMNIDDSSSRGVLTARLKGAAAGSNLVGIRWIFQVSNINLALVNAQGQFFILVHVRSDGEIYYDIVMDSS